MVVAQWALSQSGFATSLLTELARTTAAIARFVAPVLAPTPGPGQQASSRSTPTAAPQPDFPSNDPPKGDRGGGWGPPGGGDDKDDQDEGEEPPDEDDDDEPSCNSQVECALEDVIGGTMGDG